MTRPIRVLHLEDDSRDAEVIQDKLDVGNVACEIVRAYGKDTFEAALAREPFDLIISDFNLPDYDGTSAIKRALEKQPDAPVIVVSGSLGEEEAVKCLHDGATDYLLKQRLDRLVPAVRRALQEAEERQKRREAEQALLQRERRLSSLYATVADGLFHLEVEEEGAYRFISVNEAFLQSTGLRYTQVVGKRVEEVIPQPSAALALAKYGEAISQKRAVRWEETTEYPKGRVIGDVSIAPVFDDSGRCTHLVGAVHDITERKQLEAQFRQAQKMESVGQLAGGIAHDFNNLLTLINGTAELALSQLRDADPLREDLQQIRQAGEMAAGLTRQLLAFSRKQILQPQVMNLNTIVVGMENMLRRLIGEDVSLVVMPTRSLGNVKADPGQMEQVIANLAVNARDAMPQGGQLTIEMQDVDLDELYIREHGVTAKPGSYVMLAMTDSGVGMDEATRARIFEPFFTTKGPGKGTGLGLSTVYGIVKQTEGFVWVYSEVGHGTSFKIYLPRVAEPARAKPRTSAAAPARGTETILLVEDQTGLRVLAKRMLEMAGYTVLEAHDGEEALRQLADYKEPVHLVLSDVVMPGMSGRNLAEHFTELRPKMKVLYMSGYTDDAVVRHGVLDKGMPFLSKPFTATELTRKVREVLDSDTAAADG